MAEQPPIPTQQLSTPTQQPPKDVETWAQFNTWYALNNPGKELHDFHVAWLEYKAYLDSQRTRKAPKPKQSKAQKQVEEAIANPLPIPAKKPRKKPVKKPTIE